MPDAARTTPATIAALFTGRVYTRCVVKHLALMQKHDRGRGPRALRRGTIGDEAEVRDATISSARRLGVIY